MWPPSAVAINALTCSSRCAQASKAWNRWIYSIPDFFQTMIVRRRMIPSKTFMAFLNHSKNTGYKLRHVEVLISENFERQNQLYQHFTKYAEIESMKFTIMTPYFKAERYAPITLKKLVVTGSTSLCLSQVMMTLNHFTNLVHGEFKNIVSNLERFGQMQKYLVSLPQLRTLYLEAAQSPERRHLEVAATFLDRLVSITPNITKAVITGFHVVTHAGYTRQADFQPWTKLEHLDLSRTELRTTPKFPTSVLHLNLSHIHSLPVELLLNVRRRVSLGMIATEDSGLHFPELQYLNLESSNYAILANTLTNAPLTNGTLYTLNLADTSHFQTQHDPFAQNWPTSMPLPSNNLTHLSLRALGFLPESTILDCVRMYPNLEWLDVGATKATGTFLRELWERENPPKWVGVKGCAQMGEDAKKMAEEKGIKIER